MAASEPSGDALSIPHEIETVASTPQSLRGLSILQTLRDATRSAHARIEGSPAMLRLMSDDYTEPEYVQHLGRLLGFYEPFEAALAEGGADDEAPASQCRSRLLRRDLRTLGLARAQIQTLARCGKLPRVTGANLLGCLYVYEGAALGGQTIARRLRQTLPSTPSFAFYHQDAAGTGRRWRAFCLSLETRDAVSLRAICESAVAVFDTFENWLEGTSLSAAQPSST